MGTAISGWIPRATHWISCHSMEYFCRKTTMESKRAPVKNGVDERGKDCRIGGVERITNELARMVGGGEFLVLVLCKAVMAVLQ